MRGRGALIRMGSVGTAGMGRDFRGYTTCLRRRYG